MCKCSDFADDANLDGCAFVEGAEATLQKGDFVFQQKDILSSDGVAGTTPAAVPFPVRNDTYLAECI